MRRILWMSIGAIVALWTRERARIEADRHVPKELRTLFVPVVTMSRAGSQRLTKKVVAELRIALTAYLRAKRAPNVVPQNRSR